MLRGRPAAKKGEAVALLLGATPSASDRGLIPDAPTVAVDATGLDSRPTSRAFAARSGRPHAAWTKWTVAAGTATHFLAAATGTTGPSNDSPQFTPVMAQASLVVAWDRVLADAAFDAEDHHADARHELGIRSSVMPIHPRNAAGPPAGVYRSQRPARFRPKPAGRRSKRVSGRRWPAESAFARHKRRLRSTPSARSDEARERECPLRVLTHNLMLLAAHQYKVSTEQNRL